MSEPYIYFLEHKLIDKKKPIYIIKNTQNGIKLGYLKYWGAWRKYCFFPNSNTLYDNKCLQEIISKLDDLNKRRKF